MNAYRTYRGVVLKLMWLGLGLLSLTPNAAQALEETFPTLQVGIHVYTNVTVTTKAKSYIFIHHSAGMENIRVAELPDDIRTQLGYIPEVTKSQKASNWAKGKVSDIHIGEVTAAELKDPKKWEAESAIVLEKARSLDRKLCGAIMGGVLLVYLFFCFGCALICQKAGKQPGILVWLPVLQIIPMLRAAGMSPMWLLACLFMVVVPCMAPFVPPLFTLGCLVLGGILGMAVSIGGITWCFKIASARGKSPLVGFCLLLPVISFFAFLYLAFSDGTPEPAVKQDRRTEHLMTLETA